MRKSIADRRECSEIALEMFGLHLGLRSVLYTREKRHDDGNYTNDNRTSFVRRINAQGEVLYITLKSLHFEALMRWIVKIP